MLQLIPFLQFFALLFVIYLGIPVGVIISLFASEELLAAKKYLLFALCFLILLIFIVIGYSVYYLFSIAFALSKLILFYGFISFFILILLIYYYKSKGSKNKKYSFVFGLLFYTLFSCLLLFLFNYRELLLLISLLLFISGILITVLLFSFSSLAREELSVIRKFEYRFIIKLLLIFLPFLVLGVVFYFLAELMLFL